jgi:hypothetical protein
MAGAPATAPVRAGLGGYEPPQGCCASRLRATALRAAPLTREPLRPGGRNPRGAGRTCSRLQQPPVRRRELRQSPNQNRHARGPRRPESSPVRNPGPGQRFRRNAVLPPAQRGADRRPVPARPRRLDQGGAHAVGPGLGDVPAPTSIRRESGEGVPRKTRLRPLLVLTHVTKDSRGSPTDQCG